MSLQEVSIRHKALSIVLDLLGNLVVSLGLGRVAVSSCDFSSSSIVIECPDFVSRENGHNESIACEGPHKRVQKAGAHDAYADQNLQVDPYLKPLHVVGSELVWHLSHVFSHVAKYSEILDQETDLGPEHDQHPCLIDDL